jgi:hypothetical protein
MGGEYGCLRGYRWGVLVSKWAWKWRGIWEIGYDDGQ